MLKFIVRRILYSILVIAGVLVLTFILFRLAAGDPARALLGKKPSPGEVEELRRTLSSDKPLFWGHWRKTELFSSADFAGSSIPNGITATGKYSVKNSALSLINGQITITRNFDTNYRWLKMEISFRGSIRCSGNVYYAHEQAKTVSVIFDNQKIPEKIIISAEKNAKIAKIEFFRYQKNPWNSQLTDAFLEIISFTDTFPYVSFFNFGRTLITREPVKKVLGRGIVPSLSLMLPIFFGELFLGIILALISTAYRDRWPDKLIMLLSIAGMSISYIVLLVLGQWYLGYYCNFFPVWGYGSVKFLILPVIIGIISGLGGGVRFYRTIFVNELKKEYLRTAEAKGCGSTRIYLHHLLRNAAIPLITRATTILPFLFTGSLLLESFFGIPGLGYAGINALRNSDLQMVKALVIITSILFVVMNLLSDIAYAKADPRIRLE